ncbi:molybdate transporter 1-like [Juglans microcarpa x Juglans regia]|uniref:molybdate transporter 1-like n=1 Tax=Juglans microcarpa x Juglans regia TaxID=2249226 RepID=UPI001B7DF05F|nr:molybdate transporter 1-like [Juglans microcarpa x Juglans regia]
MEAQNPNTPHLHGLQNPPETARKSSVSGFTAKVVDKVKTNLVFRSKWAELNGAMGDLGTYIPIVLALTLVDNLNLGTTLIFTGLYNIITGAVYGVPMPVQPMKSIAAVAISGTGFGVPEIMASGILTGGILFVLGVTGLMQLVYKIIPLSVVRGIQLAQGLSFTLTAVKYIRKVQDFSKSIGERPWLGLDGMVLAIVCACFIAIVNGAGDEQREERDEEVNGTHDLGYEERPPRSKGGNFRRIIFSLPSAFMIFLLGVVLAFIRNPKVVNDIKFGPSSFEVVKISKHAWREGFIKGTIPQLPLSVLNSVIAVCKLSSDLFPEKDFSATSLSVTVGLMNIIGCWFGAMPSCHGAGGLAGQYKFGGRSGGCVALLGTAKLVLGLVLGSSLAKILNQFPVGVLGVLLLFAGIELAMASRDMNTKEESFVMLLCTAVSLVGSSAALGFVCGIVAHLILKLRNFSKDQSLSTGWMHGNP